MQKREWLCGSLCCNGVLQLQVNRIIIKKKKTNTIKPKHLDAF